ncbi:MAG: RNA polymerase sigma factor [Dehalococcoidia bacterium]
MASLATLKAPVIGRRNTSRDAEVRDATWFSNLYEDSIDSVYRYAHVLVKDPDRAEDVAADVFFRAWRGRHGLRDESTALSWLLTITHNSAMSMLRASRETTDIDAVSEPRDESADPSREIFTAYEADRVRDAITKLTAEQQQVVFLRFFEALPHDEVARRLNSNSNAVRATQFRALARLRKLLQEDSVAYPV